MGKRQKNKEATPPLPQATATTGQTTEERFVSYVVVRDGYRVSDKEYNDPNDPVAVAEKEFWTRVAKNHSYGEPVAIVQYDSKLHRVW